LNSSKNRSVDVMEKKEVGRLLCSYEYTNGNSCNRYAEIGSTRCARHGGNRDNAFPENRPLCPDGPNIKAIIPREDQLAIRESFLHPWLEAAPDIAAEMQRYLDDPELTNCDRLLALCDANISQILAEQQAGESATAWKDLTKLHRQLGKALLDGRADEAVTLHDAMGDVIADGTAKMKARDGSLPWIEQRRKVSETQDRHIQFMRENMAIDQVNAKIASVVQAVRLSLVGRRILELMNLGIEHAQRAEHTAIELCADIGMRLRHNVGSSHQHGADGREE
jgi:hypothetical protein